MSLTLVSKNYLSSAAKKESAKSSGFYETIRREMRLTNYNHKTIGKIRSPIDFLLKNHEHKIVDLERKIVEFRQKVKKIKK